MRRAAVIVLATLAILVALGAGALYWVLAGDAVRTTLEAQASARLGQPVRIARASLRLWPRAGLTLGDVTIGMPVRLRLGAVDLSAAPLALLSRRIEDAELRIRDTQVTLPLPLGAAPSEAPSAALPPAGDRAGAADSNGASGATSDDGANGGVRVVSVRRVSLDGVRISSRGRDLSVSAESSFEEGRLHLERLSATSGETDIEASGTIALEPRVEAMLDVRAPRLDMEELLALAAAFLPAGDAATPAAARTSDPGPRLVATVAADTATAAGVVARRLTTTLTVAEDRAALEPLAFETFGGRIAGSIRARLTSRLEATVRADVQGLDVAQLAAFGGAAGTVSGRLSGEATVTGAGATFAEALGAARGTGRATISDGAIQRLGLLRSVVLFFGRPDADAPPSTDRFDRLDARFALAEGVLEASSVALHSADLDTDGRGSLRLTSKALDATMSVMLSEAVSRQAGTDLRRYTREGNRIVLPVTVGGTLDAPSVRIDTRAVLERGLRNAVRDQVGGLLDRLRRRNGSDTSPETGTSSQGDK